MYRLQRNNTASSKAPDFKKNVNLLRPKKKQKIHKNSLNFPSLWNRRIKLVHFTQPDGQQHEFNCPLNSSIDLGLHELYEVTCTTVLTPHQCSFYLQHTIRRFSDWSLDYRRKQDISVYSKMFKPATGRTRPPIQLVPPPRN